MHQLIRACHAPAVGALLWALLLSGCAHLSVLIPGKPTSSAFEEPSPPPPASPPMPSELPALPLAQRTSDAAEVVSAPAARLVTVRAVDAPALERMPPEPSLDQPSERASGRVVRALPRAQGPETPMVELSLALSTLPDAEAQGGGQLGVPLPVMEARAGVTAAAALTPAAERTESSRATRSPTEERSGSAASSASAALSSGASAPRSAATPSSSTAPAAARQVAAEVAPAGSPGQRTYHAGVHDAIQIVLPGDGWMLTLVKPAAGRAGSSSEAVRFLGREGQAAGTVFSFEAEALGADLLTFERQNLSAGTREVEVALVRVLPEAELAAFAAEQAAPAAAGVAGGAVAPAGRAAGAEVSLGAEGTLPAAPPEVVARAAADRLYAMGFHKAALEEYLKLASAPTPELVHRVAELYALTGNHREAITYWRRNLAVPEYRDRALTGLVRSAAALGDSQIVDEYLDAFLGLKDLPVAAELAEVARFAGREGRRELELCVLEDYLARYPDGEQADEVYYRLGVLLESSWQGRDLSRSRECYETVLRDYGTGAYAGKAADRLAYLNRHFFLVR